MELSSNYILNITKTIYATTRFDVVEHEYLNVKYFVDLPMNVVYEIHQIKIFANATQ
jgi:hypothetical protein